MTKNLSGLAKALIRVGSSFSEITLIDFLKTTKPCATPSTNSHLCRRMVADLTSKSIQMGKRHSLLGRISIPCTTRVLTTWKEQPLSSITIKTCCNNRSTTVNAQHKGNEAAIGRISNRSSTTHRLRPVRCSTLTKASLCLS